MDKGSPPMSNKALRKKTKRRPGSPRMARWFRRFVVLRKVNIFNSWSADLQSGPLQWLYRWSGLKIRVPFRTYPVIKPDTIPRAARALIPRHLGSNLNLFRCKRVFQIHFSGCFRIRVAGGALSAMDSLKISSLRRFLGFGFSPFSSKVPPWLSKSTVK